MCDGQTMSLLILRAMWGITALFMYLTEPVGGFPQQGGLIVKEDHLVAGSFAVQLHCVHPGQSVLAGVVSPAAAQVYCSPQ